MKLSKTKKLLTFSLMTKRVVQVHIRYLLHQVQIPAKVYRNLVDHNLDLDNYLKMIRIL